MLDSTWVNLLIIALRIQQADVVSLLTPSSQVHSANPIAGTFIVSPEPYNSEAT